MNRYPITIDENGTAAFPAALRQMLGDTVVVTLGKDRSLQFYSAAEWSAGLDRLSPEALRRMRPMIASAAQLDLTDDAVSLPAALLAYAQLEGSAVLHEEEGRWYLCAE
jgi:DNA-binding transcriptional regulator/RsmH inhibitor MraZ